MRIFSYRRLRQLFSFASMGISRSGGRGARQRNAFKQRRDAFSAWRLNSEQLEPKKMLAVGAPGTPFSPNGELNGGGGLNAAEEAAGFVVQVPLASNAVDTDSLTLKTNGSASVGTATITAADVTAGFKNFTIASGVLGADSAAKILEATLATAGGGATFTSGQQSFLMDTVPPDTPTVDDLITNNPVSANIQVSGTTGSGSALATGETLTVTINGVSQTFNTATTTGGTWTTTTNFNLVEQTYSVTARVVDSVGNAVTDGSNNELTVDYTPPATNSITGPPNQNHGVGGIIEFRLNHDAIVFPILGVSPAITFNLAGIPRTATYSGGLSTGTQSVFRYAVVGGDNNANFINNMGFVANGAQDTATNGLINPVAFAGQYNMNIQTGAIAAPTFTNPTNTPATPIAVPVPLVLITFPAGVTVAENTAGAVGLDDFQLTRDGVVLPLTGDFNYDSFNASPTLFTISDLEGLTNEPGQYVLTFSDIGVTNDLAQVTWIKGLPTADELTATVSPFLGDGTAATGTAFETISPELAVEYVDIEFNNQVFGVITSARGAAITQFQIFRDGQQINNTLPNTVQVSQISDTAYRISGLSAVTQTAGDYQVLVGPASNITTFSSDTSIVTGTPGAPLRAVYGASWDKHDLTAAAVTLPNHLLGTYSVGEPLRFTADFQGVVVTTVPGAASINFTIDRAASPNTPNKAATYVSGSGTDTLIFEYEVDDGDFSEGIVVGTAFTGTITDVNGLQVVPAFTPAGVASLIDIDGEIPTIVSAVGPPPGSYDGTAPNNDLDITLSLSEPVVVTGSPNIPLTIGGRVRNAVMVASPTATTTLIFRYPIVNATDVFAYGSFTVGDINLNGGTIQDNSGNDADLVYPAGPPVITDVMINRTEPTVTVTRGQGTAPSTVVENKTGDVIEFTATYPQAVTVDDTTGVPSIAINVDNTVRQATYVAGSGTTDIRFQYVVPAADEDDDGISFQAAEINLNGGSMIDAAGAVETTFPTPQSLLNVLDVTNVDGEVPTIASAVGPTPGSYDGTAPNNTLDITLNFDETVTLSKASSSPAVRLPLTIGGQLREAEYLSGSGTSSTLVFRYTIASATDVYANGSFTVGALNLNGETIRDAAGNDANLAFTPPTITGVSINELTPTVTVTSNTSYNYDVNQVIEFTAAFTAAVDVTGTPTIDILVGGTTRSADYVAGSGTQNLKFRYTVQNGDIDEDGIEIPAAIISLSPTASITSVDGGVDIDPAFTPPNTIGIKVGLPRVTRIITTTPDGSYDSGAVIDITVTTSLPVRVTDAANTKLYLNTSDESPNTVVTAPGVTNSSTSVTSIDASDLFEGMVVTDSAGDIPEGTEILEITDGGIGALDTITLTQAATGSTPTNTLTFTGVSPNADYAIFLGDSSVYTTSLQFQYIVQDADSSEDLDYFGTASLKFPTDSIYTAGGITLDENLQVPGTFNSIAFNSDVVVNTTPPQVESFSTINPGGKYGTNQTIGIRATLSEAIAAGQEFKIRLDTGAEVTLTTDGTERASGVYLIQAGETTTSLKVVDILPGTLTDTSSNTLLTTLPSSITIGTITVDTKPPLITQFSVTKIDGAPVTTTTTTTGTYGIGTIFTLTATVDETVRIGSSIDVTLDNNQVVRLSAATAGTTLEGTYTVGAQDTSSTDLTVTSFSTDVLRDVAGNQITDFTVPGYPNNIGSLNNLTVDTQPPSITSFTAADGTYKENDEIEITATLSEPIAGTVVTEPGATNSSTSVTSIDASDLFEGMVVTDSEGDIPPGTQILEITDGGIGAVDTITLTQAATDSTAINTLTFTGSTFSVELNSGGSVTLIVQDGESTATGKYTVGSSDTASALTVNQILPGDVVDFGNNPLFTEIPPGQNLGDNAAIIIDNAPPEIQLLQSNVEKVNAIGTATLSIVLSEPSDDFAFANLNATNGTLDAASFSGSDANYSVDFVPTAGIVETTATITIVSSFTDRAGNTYVDTGVSETIQVDTKAPTIVNDGPYTTTLSTGLTQSINFTLSEVSGDFDSSDLTETNGLLSDFNGTGSVYSAVFTPATNFEGIGIVTIAGGVLTDSFGNPNASTDVSINIDTKAPTLTITSPPGILGGNDGNGVPPATVTFSFDEDVTGFDDSDLNETNGVLSALTGSGSSYTATFTPTAGINDTAIISFVGEVTDLNGNSTTTATPESITINTVRPTVDIDAPTTVVNGPTTVTFTLSANSTDFTDPNVVTVTGGTLGTVTVSGSSYTAIFTPNPNSTTPGAISVTDGAFTDTDGNTNTLSAPTTILVDTVAPSAPTLNLSASANSPVSKAEATSAFGIVDVAGEAGAAINILFTGSNGNSITKSATGSSDSIQLTEGDLNTLGDGAVVATAIQTDTAGNESPVSSPLEFVLDTIAPQVVAVDSSSPPGAYKSGETVTINAYLSEPVAAGQNFFVTLNTNSLIVLTTAGGGATLTGTYIVSGTANADPLAITDILNNTVADTSGNPLSTNLPQQVTFDGIKIDTIAPQPATLSLVATEPVSAAEAVATSGFATVQGEAGASIVVTITGTNNQNDPITRNLLGTGSAQALLLVEAELTTLGEGLVTLTAVQTDAAGNRQITPDSTELFTLDTTPPNQFDLLYGANVEYGATVTEATQATGIVRFTGEAGSSITVTVTDSAGTQHVLNPIIGTGSEQAVRKTIADLSVLADGLLVISAVQTDAAGNTQSIPAELTVVLDRVAPSAPSLTIRDNVSSPLTLGEVTDTNGVINVLGEDGAELVVAFSGQNGGFQKPLTGTGFNQPITLDATEAAILGEGSIAITATQTDAAGNISTQGTLPVVIDQTAPEVLELELDADPDFYGEGDSIPLSGTLSEAAIPGQILRVVLNVLEADNVTPVIVDVTVAANGTDLAGAYVVQAGHNKDDLSINSFTNDHPSTPVTDVAGNPLLDSSSSSGGNQKSSASSSGFVGGQSSGIVVDTVAPEVIEWITTEGTYVVDDTVMIQLRVNEPAAAGSTINVRTNTLGIFRQDIVLNLDANDPTLFTGQYTVALGERANELVLSVTSANMTDRAGNSLNLGNVAAGNQSGRIIRGSISLGDSENGMQWGPAQEDGSPSVLINLSTGVTGLNIGAITLSINGRTISLRDASVSQTSYTNYILRLPQRLASLGGGFTITIWSSDIRSILDPDVGLDDAIEFTLPDAGMNTDSETGAR